MVFAPTSEAAQACASPIRNVLWGAHKVAVLLPKGEEPIKVDFLLQMPFAAWLLADCTEASAIMQDAHSSSNGAMQQKHVPRAPFFPF